MYHTAYHFSLRFHFDMMMLLFSFCSLLCLGVKQELCHRRYLMGFYSSPFFSLSSEFFRSPFVSIFEYTCGIDNITLYVVQYENEWMREFHYTLTIYSTVLEYAVNNDEQKKIFKL